MPSIPQHRSKAEHNEAFLRLLDPAKGFRSWYVTGLFYAALHRMDALLHHRGCSDFACDSHGKRWAEIRHRLSHERPLRHYYRQMYDDSIAARYSVRQFTIAEVNELLNRHYIPLKRRVRQLLV